MASTGEQRRSGPGLGQTGPGAQPLPSWPVCHRHPLKEVCAAVIGVIFRMDHALGDPPLIGGPRARIRADGTAECPSALVSDALEVFDVVLHQPDEVFTVPSGEYLSDLLHDHTLACITADDTGTLFRLPAASAALAHLAILSYEEDEDTDGPNYEKTVATAKMTAAAMLHAQPVGSEEIIAAFSAALESIS